MYKIMIVEDDNVISLILENHLEKWGYQVECITDFSEVLSNVTDFAPDLVLLDIHLPLFDGYHWCREIRNISRIPIIFISSANENMNIVMAMNMGGDDFISKPFNLNVITAKIQAVLRRTYSFAPDFHLLTYNDVILDVSSATISFKNAVLDLTKNEVKILELMFQKPETIMSREEIMNFLWDDHQFVDDNTLSVNVNRLRKKLETIGLVDFIKTKKGMGYLI